MRLNGWQVAELSLGGGGAGGAGAGAAARGATSIAACWLVGAAFAATLVVFVVANKLTTAANAIFLQSTAPLYILLLAPRLLGEHFAAARPAASWSRWRSAWRCSSSASSRRSPARPSRVRGNLVAALERSDLGADRDRPALAEPRRRRPAARCCCSATSSPAWSACRWRCRWRAATAADWALIVYLGVFQIVVAYLLVSAGLRHLTALEGMLLLLLEPVLNPVWAALVQGEVPGALSLAGGAVILGATVWKTVSDAR